MKGQLGKRLRCLSSAITWTSGAIAAMACAIIVVCGLRALIDMVWQ